MKQEGLRYFTDMPLMVFGMLLFFTTFIGVLGFTLLGAKTKARMEKLGQIPLQEDDAI